MNIFNIAYAAETTSSNVSVSMKTGVMHAITSASLPVQLTLIILIMMSVVSWAIIFTKKRQFQEVTEDNNPFLDLFWKANSLDEIFEKIGDYPRSTIASVFKTGYLELRKIADSQLKSSNGEGPILSGIDNLERSLRKAIDTEIARLELKMNFLATTGSTGPFIGLFGTVWGIMSSFQKIGETGMASLAVVAPGISEALIATAIGLFAAIPASVGFNHYISKLKKEELELNNFSNDFLNIVKRNFFIEK